MAPYHHDGNDVPIIAVVSFGPTVLLTFGEPARAFRRRIAERLP